MTPDEMKIDFLARAFKEAGLSKTWDKMDRHSRVNVIMGIETAAKGLGCTFEALARSTIQKVKDGVIRISDN